MNFSKHWAAVLDDYAIDLAWSPDGSLLAVASAAGGVTLFQRRRDGPTFVAGVWIVGVAALTFALTPLPWARYYLPALPPLYALAAIGIGRLARSLRRSDRRAAIARQRVSA